jgi:hypothetical protein
MRNFIAMPIEVVKIRFLVDFTQEGVVSSVAEGPCRQEGANRRQNQFIPMVLGMS